MKLCVSFFRHTHPVQVLPGDILRITCVYGAKDAKHPISWGHLSTNEICAATIEYYPKASWTATTCTSYKSIPLCQLETTGIAQGCNFQKFFETLNRDERTYNVLKTCSTSGVCDSSCKGIAKAALSHPCVKGDCGSLMKSPITTPNERLDTFFKVIGMCGQTNDVQQRRLND